MAVLNKDLKLHVDDFEQDAALNDCIKDYHRLMSNYLSTVHHQHVVQTREDFLPLKW